LRLIYDYDRPTVKNRVSRHYKSISEIEGTYSGKRSGERESIAQAIEGTLESTNMFHETASNLEYHADVKNNRGWHEKTFFGSRKSIPVAAYALREGPDGICSIIHVVDFSKTTGKELYKFLKEIAGESLSNKKRFLSSGSKTIKLPQEIHQNVVVVNNDHSIPKFYGKDGEGNDLYKFKPTVGLFLPTFTGTVNYVDAGTYSLRPTMVIDPGPIEDSHEKDKNVVARKSEVLMPDFSLKPEGPVHIQDYMTNWKGRKSSDIRKWKLAEFEPAEESAFHPVPIQKELFEEFG
jgi:hypothetical protein